MSVIDYFRYDYLFYYFRYYKDILPKSMDNNWYMMLNRFDFVDKSLCIYQLARISELKKVSHVAPIITIFSITYLLILLRNIFSISGLKLEKIL